MIVRDLSEVLGSGRDVSGLGWNSRRLLVRTDGMGYSLTDTIIDAGAEMTLEYKNHLEACYCVSGEGEVEDHATGKIYMIEPGTLYALDKHDRHTLRARTESEMRLVCVFNPPLDGSEVHGPDGSYS